MWLIHHETGVLGTLPPCGMVTKDTWARYLFPLEWTEARRIKDGDNKYQLITMIQTKLLSLLNEWLISGPGVKLFQQPSFSLILLIGMNGILRSFYDNPWDIIDKFDDKPTLFQVMAWCRQWLDAITWICIDLYLRHYIEWLGHNEFSPKANFRIMLGSLTGLLDRIRWVTASFVI